MKFLWAFRTQLRQALSWPVALCGLLTVLLMELSVAELIADQIFERASYTSVWYLINSTGANLPTLFVLPPLPFAMSLARDWGIRALPYWTVRAGIARYTVSKLLASALAGMLTVGLGMTLFVLANGTFLPWFASCTSEYYEALFESGHIFLGWICYILHMSLSGALIGAPGMFMSICAQPVCGHLRAPCHTPDSSAGSCAGWDAPA